MVAQVCADVGKEGIEPVFASFGLKRGNEWLGMVELGEKGKLKRNRRQRSVSFGP